MSSPLWMPLFGDDFWGSERVAQMSDSAVALYSWLLWQQFKNGDLPPTSVLRRMSPRWPGKAFDKLWPEVASCFEVSPDGRLSNPRCREVRAEQEARAERLRTSAGRANRIRWDRERALRSDSGADPERSPTRTPAGVRPDSQESREEERRESPPTPLGGAGGSDPSQPDTSPPALDAALAALPGLDTPRFRGAWAEWEQHRRELRLKPYKPTGLRRCLAQLAEIGPERAADAIAHSIGKAWQSIHEGKNGAPVPGRNGSSSDGAWRPERLFNPETDFG